MRVQLLMKRIPILLLLLLLAFSCAAAEGAGGPADAARLDFSSGTLTQKVTVKSYIDGDTVHFRVPASVWPDGVLKARFLAVNTPETTGKIEEYGKKASAYTRDKLEHASSIVVESDNGSWNRDSTGARVLVWVWYLPEGGSEYRNLNIELLQEGLAIANSSANNRYGDLCMAAIGKAKEEKKNIYSGQRDPDFYYGDAIELTLRELRLHPEEYNGKKVAFNGVITVNSENSVYIEDLDPESGLPFGISVYYGYNLSGGGLDVLRVGNLSRIVGTMQYYENGGTWQVSGLSYRMMKPKDPGNIQKISEGNPIPYTAVSAEGFLQEVTVTGTEGSVTRPYAALTQAATVQITDPLTVNAVYGRENGMCMLLCTAGSAGIRIYAPESAAENVSAGKKILVRGITDMHNGEWQIRVFTLSDITVCE